ncbi:hypothetical protein AB4144_47760, partial [Rhizobiaceae sp. 2RAB30]
MDQVSPPQAHGPRPQAVFLKPFGEFGCGRTGRIRSAEMFVRIQFDTVKPSRGHHSANSRMKLAADGKAM